MEGSLKELAGYRLDRAKEMHSGVIAYFTKKYLKTEILDRGLAVIIKDSSLCRENGGGRTAKKCKIFCAED